MSRSVPYRAGPVGRGALRGTCIATGVSRRNEVEEEGRFFFSRKISLNRRDDVQNSLSVQSIVPIYWISLRTDCGWVFACAIIALPAWLRIWLLVKFTISCAMSVSRMRDSAACRFSDAIAIPS